jgi:hypothetical protein
MARLLAVTCRFKYAQIDPKINRSFVYYPWQMEIPGSREVPSPCVQTLTYTAQHRDNVERTNYENTWTVVDGMYPHCKMYIYICGKNKIFWRKIVIYHTKYPKYFRASLRSAQFF